MRYVLRVQIRTAKFKATSSELSAMRQLRYFQWKYIRLELESYSITSTMYCTWLYNILCGSLYCCTTFCVAYFTVVQHSVWLTLLLYNILCGLLYCCTIFCVWHTLLLYNILRDWLYSNTTVILLFGSLNCCKTVCVAYIIHCCTTFCVAFCTVVSFTSLDSGRLAKCVRHTELMYTVQRLDISLRLDVWRNWCRPEILQRCK